MFYDKEGNKVSEEIWTKIMQNDGPKISRMVLDNGIVVSTIWTGFDFRLDESDYDIIFEARIPFLNKKFTLKKKYRPKIYETMVFDRDGNGLETIKDSNLRDSRETYYNLVLKYEKADF